MPGKRLDRTGMAPGIACDINSRGFKALCKATEDVVAIVEPYADAGNLPLVKELQDDGFDVQLTGFGLSGTYHANEHCLISDMCQGFEILLSIISQLEDI